MSLLSGTLRELAGFTEALRAQARARAPRTLAAAADSAALPRWRAGRARARAARCPHCAPGRRARLPRVPPDARRRRLHAAARCAARVFCTEPSAL
jgi:hypothetical protein